MLKLKLLSPYRKLEIQLHRFGPVGLASSLLPYPSSPSPPLTVFLSLLAVDLLKRMLVLDCDGRISASEALSHPYFSQYHDPDDEPEAPPYDQTLESKDRTLEEWKGKLLFEIHTVYVWKFTSICWNIFTKTWRGWLQLIIYCRWKCLNAPSSQFLSNECAHFFFITILGAQISFAEEEVAKIDTTDPKWASSCRAFIFEDFAMMSLSPHTLARMLTSPPKYCWFWNI